MTKLSRFTRTFNLQLNLFKIAIGSFLTSKLFSFISKILSQYFSKFSQELNEESLLISYLSLLCLLILLVFITYEVVDRIRNDSINNYFQSILQTFMLRHYLKQHEHNETVSLLTHNRNIITHHPVIRDFNRTILKSVIDIRKDEILVDIRIPRGQQAQKLLNDMTTDIRVAITSYNPDYYISIPELTISHLFYKGTKR